MMTARTESSRVECRRCAALSIEPDCSPILRALDGAKRDPSEVYCGFVFAIIPMYGLAAFVEYVLLLH